MQSRIAVFIFLAIALAFAVVVGSNVAMAEYKSLSFYVFGGIAVYFVVNGWKNVWWFTALLVFSGVVFYQGFMFEAYHLFVLMLFVATCLSVTNRQSMPTPPEFLRAGSRTPIFAVGLLITYGILHFLFNFSNPYNPLDYSWKTSTKAYFESFSSMVCFFWLLAGSYGFIVKRNWGLFFIFIVVFALVGNVFVRGYMFSQGFMAADGLDSEMTFTSLNVPVINMNPGVYTLRDISPLGTVILLMLATTPNWWRNQKPWVKLMILSGLLSCMLGALFGGGRITLLFCLGLGVLVALTRRNVRTIFAIGAGSVLVVAVVNIFSTQINRDAPAFISRSLQFVMLERGDTFSTINDSQHVRNLAIQAGIKDWQTDERTFFFGRSVFYVNPEDAVYTKETLGWDGFVINALRSGRTHNLVSDLLVQYGLTGLVLYLIAYLSVIRFYWRLYRVVPDEAVWSKALAGAMKLYLPLVLFYQLLGGNYLPTAAALIIGLIRADLVTFHPALVSAPKTGPDPRALSAQPGRLRGTLPAGGTNR